MGDPMKIVDEEVMDHFRRKTRCELCGKYSRDGMDPHHLFGRGMGGWRRFDVAVNLISLCRICHNAFHAGRIERAAILAVVAAREGMTAAEVEEKILALRKH